ncbi:MAG TPA: aldehyde dehydrogenase family protein, partial [Mycobacterium sp.]
VVNSGQSCNAGSRILVPAERMDEVAEIAKKAAEAIVVGPPDATGTTVGPVVSALQFDKIQRLIQSGIDEGGTLVVGGLGRPAGLTVGYYVKPTIFADVTNDMTIAREEIFGPVMTFIGYEGEGDAVRIANESNYGLAGMVSSGNLQRARRVARQMRTGMVHLNGAPLTADAPFGGYKQSGNGREYGKFGLHDFLEAKAIFGDNAE